MELVSQAEKEGITLAAMVSREMSTDEMDCTQEDLSSRLSENYSKIETFMSGIRVPSMEEILSRNDGLLPEIDIGSINVLSDKYEAGEDRS